MSKQSKTQTEIAAEFDQIAAEVRAQHPEIPLAPGYAHQLLSEKLDTARDLVVKLRRETAREQLVGTLADLERLIETSQSAMRTTVALLRHQGMSWVAIGELLGITRQAAQQRFSG